MLLSHVLQFISLGLKQKIEKRVVGLCSALPLLPRDMITDGWKYIQDECPDLSKVNKFINYVQKYWMKNKKKIFYFLFVCSLTKSK